MNFSAKGPAFCLHSKSFYMRQLAFCVSSSCCLFTVLSWMSASMTVLAPDSEADQTLGLLPLKITVMVIVTVASESPLLLVSKHLVALRFASVFLNHDFEDHGLKQCLHLKYLSGLFEKFQTREENQE